MKYDSWHKLTVEAPIEPDLPICDAHHHLWHGGPSRRERYLLDEMLHDIKNSGHNVVSTVYCEGHAMYRQDGPAELKSLGETEFANGIAAMCASGEYGPVRIAEGIVGYADLMLGDGAERVLESHMRASPRFRGVRYSTCWDANPDQLRLYQPAPKGLAYDATFRKGLRSLQRLGLSFDAWMLFPQLSELVDLANAMPDLNIVLGHIGGLVGVGPYANHAEVLPVWKRNIAAVAECPNVSIKVGGMGMLRLGFGWENREKPASSEEMAAVFEPYCLHCIEHFGPQRCMFETNFPVDGHANSYTVIWNAFKRITASFSANEKAELYLDAARRAYRLTK